MNKKPLAGAELLRTIERELIDKHVTRDGIPPRALLAAERIIDTLWKHLDNSQKLEVYAELILDEK
jgi:hypothetical protein